jgi:RimJ/RimL family protein N-acetyltransferase
MAHPDWPLFDLRITTPRLELRYPDDEMIARLAALAAEGIHDPASMPFSVPWTRQPAGVLEREAIKHYWFRRGTLTPTDWHVPFAVSCDGELVGVQDCFAVNFPVLRTVQTGSWLGMSHHGQGIGKEMRAAVLHLAFAGLAAQRAETSAWEDNTASIKVTESLGYQENGDEFLDREGTRTRMFRFALSREVWEQRRRHDIALENVEACVELLGAS